MKNCGKSKLKYVCEISAGQSAPQGNDKYSENGIPFIRAGNLEALTLRGNEGLCQKVSQAVAKEHKLKLYPKGTILFAKSGMSTKKGYVHVLKENAYVVSHLACIIPTDKIEPDFLKYYFLYNKPNRLVRDDSYPSISLLDISNITIPLPTLTDQILIINIFKKIEKQIFNKKLQLEKLEQLAKSRFIEMFGDYFDNENILCKLQDICTATIGLTYKPTNVVPNGITVLRSGNIQNNELYLIDDIVQVDNIKINDDKFIRPYDILMCSRNGSSHLVGKSCLITETKERMTFGAFMTVIRSNYPYFTQGFFLSDFFKRQLTGTQTTSVNQITTKMLYNYHTIKPTEEEENRFASFIQQLDKSKFRAKKCLKLFSYIRHLRIIGI